MHTSNREPRHSWSRPVRGRYSFSDFGGPNACASCGERRHLSCHLGVPFCRDCLAWSRQAEIDDDYDDLGVGD